MGRGLSLPQQGNHTGLRPLLAYVSRVLHLQVRQPGALPHCPPSFLFSQRPSPSLPCIAPMPLLFSPSRPSLPCNGGSLSLSLRMSVAFSGSAQRSRSLSFPPQCPSPHGPGLRFLFRRGPQGDPFQELPWRRGLPLKELVQALQRQPAALLPPVPDPQGPLISRCVCTAPVGPACTGGRTCEGPARVREKRRPLEWLVPLPALLSHSSRRLPISLLPLPFP